MVFRAQTGKECLDRFILVRWAREVAREPSAGETDCDLWIDSGCPTNGSDEGATKKNYI